MNRNSSAHVSEAILLGRFAANTEVNLVGQCYNSIVVDAPASEVWNALRNFHDLSWAAGVIESLDVVGDKGAFEAGARRLLNGVFAETLIDLDDESKTIRYSINDGPGPMATAEVASYEGRAQVFPITATDQSFVLWTSEYKANDEPAVGELCNPIYHALLAALAARFAA